MKHLLVLLAATFFFSCSSPTNPLPEIHYLHFVGDVAHYGYYTDTLHISTNSDEDSLKIWAYYRRNNYVFHNANISNKEEVPIADFYGPLNGLFNDMYFYVESPRYQIKDSVWVWFLRSPGLEAASKR